MLKLAVFVALLGVTDGIQDINDITDHSDTWVVIVGASRFWYNYRHESNVLAIYKTVKQLGVPDSRIILMISEGFACNPRNIYPGRVYSTSDLDTAIDVYGDDVEVDYRGYEVTPENFIRLLTGRHDSSVPRSKRLLSDENSNVFLYMTGHGGEGFLKFQDSEIISSEELGDSVTQMAQRGRFKEMLTMFDTCHAESLCDGLVADSIICMTSAHRKEDSYAIDRSTRMGLYMIDAWTDRILGFTDGMSPESDKTLMELFDYANHSYITRSHPQLHYSKNMEERVKTAKITDFLGNRLAMKLLPKVPKMSLEKRAVNDGSGGGGDSNNNGGWIKSVGDGVQQQEQEQQPAADRTNALVAAALVAAGLASTVYSVVV